MNKLIIPIIIVIVIAAGIGAYFVFQKLTFPQPQIGKYQENQELTIQRFGVDGLDRNALKIIAEIGDGWSGVNAVGWQLLEPQPPVGDKRSYQWDKFNRLIPLLQETKRKVQLNIEIDSNWAVEWKGKQPVRIKPQYLDDWEAFITTLVKRYPDLTLIQIGSEAENIWTGPEGYLEGLCGAYKAAKKTNPNVQIMAAGFNVGEFFGLTPEEQTELLSNPFVQKKMKFFDGFFPQAKNCFDILTIHLNQNDPSIIPPTVAWFGEQMEKNGYNKPIWADDMKSDPLYVGLKGTAEDQKILELMARGDPETIKWQRSEQSQLLVKKAVIAFVSGIEKVFLSSDIDWSFYSMPAWRYTGLLDAKGLRKPAFYTYKLLVLKLDGFIKVEKLSDNVYKFSFENKNPVFVLWGKDKSKPVDLSPHLKTQQVKIIHIVTELDRNNNPQYLADEIVSANAIQVNKEPVFVEEK